LWDVPPGLGKSRIIGALAVFLKTRKKPCDISIVFPSEILLETDREMYTKIATMLSIEIKLHVGLTVEELDAIRPNTLLILDEGDWYLLDLLGNLPKSYMGIIAMTATVVGSDNGIEMKYLTELGFKMNDSKIPPNFDTKENLTSISVDEFASRMKSQRARLIWCNNDKVAHFLNKMEV